MPSKITEIWSPIQDGYQRSLSQKWNFEFFWVFQCLWDQSHSHIDPTSHKIIILTLCMKVSAKKHPETNKVPQWATNNFLKLIKSFSSVCRIICESIYSEGILQLHKAPYISDGIWTVPRYSPHTMKLN